MRRTVPVLTLSLLLALTGCGGKDEPKAKPTPSTSPSESSTPTPSPTPTPTPTPTVPPLITGKYGVHVKITNWEKFGAQPEVQAFDAFLVAVSGSIKQRKVLPDLVKLSTQKRLAVDTRGVQLATTNNWHLPDPEFLRIESVSHAGAARTRITTCSWDPSEELVDAKGDYVSTTPVKKQWSRAVWTLKRVGGTWKVDASEPKNTTCPGGAPA